MGRDELRVRENWQNYAAGRGIEAEIRFRDVMSGHLERSDLIGADQPKDLSAIYGANIWASGNRGHGIKPEFVIRNQRTGQAVFVEVKRQGTRGNAHERACKFMMPGILESARKIAKQPSGVIPFWWVFTNGLANHPRYQQEIRHWFKGIDRHVLLWEDLSDESALLNHFDTHIRPLLG